MYIAQKQGCSFSWLHPGLEHARAHDRRQVSPVSRVKDCIVGKTGCPLACQFQALEHPGQPDCRRVGWPQNTWAAPLCPTHASRQARQNTWAAAHMPSGRLDGVSTPYWFACTAIATVGRAEQLNCVPPRCHGAGFAPELYGAPLVEGDILSAEVGAHGMFGGICDVCWTLLGRPPSIAIRSLLFVFVGTCSDGAAPGAPAHCLGCFQRSAAGCGEGWTALLHS